MGPLISVIIPVYNVENYLNRCVESVINQTYKNIEIILIDDGSTDYSFELCDLWKEKDNRVKVLHKENGGQADARNVGMTIAKGSYVTFVDSDDYIHPQYVELLVKGLDKEKADIAISDIKLVYSTEPVKMNISNSDEVSIRGYAPVDGLCQILYQTFHDVSVGGMMVSTEIARKYPFPLGKLFEDFFVTHQYFLNGHRAAFIFKPIYFYYQRSGSTMRTTQKNNFILDLIEASNLVVENCSFDEELKRAAISKRFSNYCMLLPLLKSKPNKIYKKVTEQLLQDRLMILFNPKCRLKNRIAALSLIFGITGLQLLYKVKKG